MNCTVCISPAQDALGKTLFFLNFPVKVVQLQVVLGSWYEPQRHGLHGQRLKCIRLYNIILLVISKDYRK